MCYGRSNGLKFVIGKLCNYLNLKIHLKPFLFSHFLAFFNVSINRKIPKKLVDLMLVNDLIKSHSIQKTPSKI